MHMVSLTSLIEDAVFHEPGIRRDRGNVGSLEELLKPENVGKLEEHYAAFAFLAFDPAADAAVAKYLAEGTAANDSGPNILTLVVARKGHQVPTRFDPEILGGVVIEKADLPASQFIGALFGDRVPPLPGVAIFDRFDDDAEAVYFQLAGLSSEQVRTRLREVFSVANDAIKGADGGERLAERLALFGEKKKRQTRNEDGEVPPFEFARSGPVSARQWLAKTLGFLNRHSADLIALVSLFKGG